MTASARSIAPRYQPSGCVVSGIWSIHEETVIMVANVCLLACYTWGCHVLRHVVGGFMNEVSKSPVCDFAYACATGLNSRHQLFAWCSLTCS